MKNTDRIKEALKIAGSYSQIDGVHHKAWTIDQMVRALLQDDYDDWINGFCAGGTAQIPMNGMKE